MATTKKMSGTASEAQRSYLMSLLKKHKGEPAMKQCWEELKPFWDVTEVAPGVKQGEFADNLPKQLASEIIDRLVALNPSQTGSAATSGAAYYDEWKKRVGTFWIDPGTSTVVKVQLSQDGERVYGMAGDPGDSKLKWRRGALTSVLVPLTRVRFDAEWEKHPDRCPICRKKTANLDTVDHYNAHTEDFDAAAELDS